MKRLALLCLFLSLFSIPSSAQVPIGGKGELSGLFCGDYYWFANHHNEDIEGNNGFWIRRIYLTYEHQISDSFSSRVRLQMDHEGDFQGDSDMAPTVKDAYLKWENENHAITAGISSSPTFGLVEDVWGYRSVEKSPLDLYNFASSRDLGIAFIGDLGKVNYHFSFGNGNGESADFNRGKKVMLSLGYELTEHLIVEVYGDWDNSYKMASDLYTLQGFIGYQSDVLNFGALYARQLREETIGPDLELDLVSLFTRLKFSDKTNGFLRVDRMFDPYFGGEDNAYIPFNSVAESTFLVGGIDVKLNEMVHLMPNIEAIFYGKNPFGTLDADVIPRLTLSFEF